VRNLLSRFQMMTGSRLWMYTNALSKKDVLTYGSMIKVDDLVDGVGKSKT
jgi:hypothetical protein